MRGSRYKSKADMDYTQKIEKACAAARAMETSEILREMLLLDGPHNIAYQ